MLSTEVGVSPDSDYYIHTVSAQAKAAFFYPVCTGYFRYDSSYHIQRSAYDSFLLIYIFKGSCIVQIGEISYTASQGQVVLLDCYKPHGYSSISTEWEALWLHFDGPLAREYYQLITAKLGNIISLCNPNPFVGSLRQIYNTFRNNYPIKEFLISKHIVDALTELFEYTQDFAVPITSDHIIDNTILYINEHLCSNLTLTELAGYVSLSPFYFTRMFKKKTGFTPYEYIITARINNAKFLLKNTDHSIKEIAFCTGFSCESSFCTTFKKCENKTPSNYRHD